MSYPFHYTPPKRKRKPALVGIKGVLPQAVRSAVAASHGAKGGIVRMAIIDQLDSGYRGQGYRSIKRALIVALRRKGHKVTSSREMAAEEAARQKKNGK